jgi:transcriptional antiterminator
MMLHLDLLHRKNHQKSFYDILDVDSEEVSSLIQKHGKDGLMVFINKQRTRLPSQMDNFDILGWEFK